MDPLKLEAAPAPFPRTEREADRRIRAFRVMDSFALEAYLAARLIRGLDGETLAREIRRVVARCGGALVAACAAPTGGDAERQLLETVRSGLLEARYYLYLARRLGFFDLKQYRSLTSRQEPALREVESLLAGAGAGAGGRPL